MSVLAFRILLVASIVLVVISIVADVSTTSLLPPLLELHVDRWGVLDNSPDASGEGLYLYLGQKPENTAGETVAMVLFVPLLGAVVASYIGLFRLRAWGVWMLVVVAVLSIPMSAFMPVVHSGLAAMFYDASSMLGGAILAIVFVGPMRIHFFGDHRERMVLSCPRCGRKLRVPVLNQIVTVTCPCGHQFDHLSPSPP